jgi:hypothetical protein
MYVYLSVWLIYICGFNPPLADWFSQVVPLGVYLYRQGHSISGMVTFPHSTLPSNISSLFPSLPFPSLAFPSLPLPSLAFPSLAFPSLAFPCLPFPCLPLPSLAFPSLPFPSLPFPSLQNCRPLLPENLQKTTLPILFIYPCCRKLKNSQSTGILPVLAFLYHV